MLYFIHVKYKEFVESRTKIANPLESAISFHRNFKLLLCTTVRKIASGREIGTIVLVFVTTKAETKAGDAKYRRKQ